jgi:hypothetical protein
VAAGPHHLGRVRVEGHQHARQAALLRELDGAPDQGLVAFVDPVEHADGDDAAAPAAGEVI